MVQTITMVDCKNDIRFQYITHYAEVEEKTETKGCIK
jgi:hypothetical protein